MPTNWRDLAARAERAEGADRADPNARDSNGLTLWEGLEAFEAHERAEGRICNANLLLRAAFCLAMAERRPGERWRWRMSDNKVPPLGSKLTKGR